MARKAVPRTAGERAEEFTLPSVWTERHRFVAGKPWSFKGREYLRDIHDDRRRQIRVRKAAQLGFTEVAQNRLVHAIDFGISSMLVLATDDDAKRHSKARFQALVEESPYIKGIFREVDSVDVKRSLNAALYFEGSNSRSALYSVPIGLLIVDEVDRCVPAALEAATHRLDGHENPCEMWISTPTFPELGIDREFHESDQKHWHVACPKSCGWDDALTGDAGLETWPAVRWDGWPNAKWAEPHAVAATARIQCPKCAHPWSDAEKKAAISGGKWVAHREGHHVSGYSISQLCSPTVSITDLAYRYFLAVNDSSPEKLRQFVNQCLGLPFLGEGEEIRPEDVRKLVVRGVAKENTMLSMGADIGKVIHAAIGCRRGEKLVVTKYLALHGWHELDNLLDRERIVSAVVDHNPERRNAEEFCGRHLGVAYRADHPEGMKETYHWDVKTSIVQIAHVSAVDLLLSRIRRERLEIHENDQVEEAIRHLANLGVVLMRNDRTGQSERRVVKRGADHQAFATIYLEAAASRVMTSGAIGFDADPALGGDGHDDFDGADPAWGESMAASDPLETWRVF